MFQKKFPNTRQTESKDCGPACLQMICKYYGKYHELEYLRQICGLKKEGISIYDYIKASEKLNMRSQAFKISYWKFRNEIPLPCVIYWQGYHFAIVYKITDKHIYVSDPREGLIRYNLRDFARGWLREEEKDGHKSKKGICIVTEPTTDFRSDGIKQRQSAGFMDVMKFLWGYMSLYKRYYLKIMALMIVISLISVLFPVITQNVIDLGIPSGDTGFITVLLIASLVLTVSRSLGTWIQQLMSTHIATKIKLSMQSDFISKMFKLPFQFFDTRLMGDIMQRNNDYDRLETFVMSTGVNFVLAIIQLILFGSILLFYSPLVFAIFLTSSIIYSTWVLFFWSIRKKMDIRYFTYLASNQSQWIEMLSNMTDIKNYNYGVNKRWQWEKIQIKLFKTRIKLLNVDQFQNMGSTLINSFSDLLLIYVSALAVINQDMTMGMLLSVQYILGMLGTPMNTIIQFIVSTQLINISYQRVMEIMNQRTEGEQTIQTENTALIDFNQPIRLRNVFFKYSVNDEYILKNISCDIPKGKMIAVVGESGCGKSTLIKILSRLYMPSGGKITLGEQNLASVPFDTWREKCGVLSQDSGLLNDTIFNNITFGREYDEERFVEAVTIANIKADIEKMPRTYETYIKENGKGVSEGQKQRILLARAIYGHPEYLFLDELTSSLDSNNEFSIISAIKQLNYSPTIIIISHRLSSIQQADLIIAMKDGMIEETGNHKILMLKDGVYRKIFEKQQVYGKEKTETPHGGILRSSKADA